MEMKKDVQQNIKMSHDSLPTHPRNAIRRAVMGCAVIVVVLLFASCSTTRGLREGEQLFIGLTKIEYTEDSLSKESDHHATVKEEIEAALATAPNGALFGSSYYRTPFPYGLWIWNAFSSSKNKIAQWITKTFGKAPVLLRQVNPELRASVAQSVLHNHGYLNGTVSYKIVEQKNPKKAKIGYSVNFGRLFTVDSLEYVNFPDNADSLINLSKDEALIKPGTPLDVSTMDAERNRLATIFRNNGYYYYQPSFASYLADTTMIPGKARLRLQLADNLPAWSSSPTLSAIAISPSGSTASALLSVRELSFQA